MLGELDRACKKVTVVGGGIAGLLAAYYLDRAGYEVTLMEASSRLGGLLSTEQAPEGLAENAAHSLLCTPPVLELFSDLEVPLVEVRPGSRARAIFRKGKLRRFPLGVRETVGAFLRAYFVRTDKNASAHTLTLSAWGERLLGKAATDYLLSPFTRGIYGVEPGQILVQAAFPQLFLPPGHSLLSYALHRRLRRARTRPASRARMMAPRDGMGALIEALHQRLRARLGPRLMLSAPVERLPAVENLVLTVPPLQAALLLSEQVPLSQALRSIRVAPLVSMTAFLDRTALKRLPRGVGVLFPKCEEQGSLLGILFNSSAFAHRVRDESQTVSVTLIFGGEEHRLETADDALRAIAENMLARLFGRSGPRLIRDVHIARWPRAVPTYDDAVLRAWETARATWCARPGRILFGNYTGQVSIRGMIESAAAGFLQL